MGLRDLLFGMSITGILVGSGCVSEKGIKLDVYDRGVRSSYEGTRRMVGYELLDKYNANVFLIYTDSSSRVAGFYIEMFIGTNCCETSDISSTDVDLIDYNCTNGVSKLPNWMKTEELK